MGKLFSQTDVQARERRDAELERLFRISQNARIAAVQARREAIEEFWGGVGKGLRNAIRRVSALSQRAWHPRRHHA